MALGFAAFLLFMKATRNASGELYGEANKKSYPIKDDNAATIADKWNQSSLETFVHDILADENLWECDLSIMPGFAETLLTMIISLQREGALAVLEEICHRRTVKQAS